MRQFWIWSENFHRRLKCIYINVFNFSSKNPSRTLASLSRSINPSFTLVRFSWHKVAWPCWKVKHSQNLVDLRPNFSLLIYSEHSASLQITKTSINAVLFIVSFCCFLFCRYLGLVTVHQFLFPDLGSCARSQY